MKNLKKIGKTLNRYEQSMIKGGLRSCGHVTDPPCYENECCQGYVHGGGTYCFVPGSPKGTGCIGPIEP